MSPLIVSYTNKVKDYCDEQFLYSVYALSQGHPVIIVDNTIGDEYFERLKKLTRNYENFEIHHIELEYEPKDTLFYRNVEASTNYLRDEFLRSDLDGMFIIESDVLAPPHTLTKFQEDIKTLPKDWGILGGLYYIGFHDYRKKGLQRTHHVLSGCSIYKRDLLKKFKFRWDPNDLRNFPDAYMCYDSGQDFSLWNDHDLRCLHMENAATGMRYSHLL